MSWTQPVCSNCWETVLGKPFEPTKLIDPDKEVCCFCGRDTYSGIYYRVNPATVPYPSEEKEYD